MDNYTVEFRIYGVGLDTDEISQILGLTPSTIQQEGEKRDRNTEFRQSMWGYGKTTGNGLLQWQSLEDGIQDLLLDLLPLKSQLLNCSKESQFIFWCGHFHDTFGSGPMLSNHLLVAVSNLRASIEISTYYDDGAKGK